MQNRTDQTVRECTFQLRLSARHAHLTQADRLLFGSVMCLVKRGSCRSPRVCRGGNHHADRTAGTLEHCALGPPDRGQIELARSDALHLSRGAAAHSVPCTIRRHPSWKDRFGRVDCRRVSLAAAISMPARQTHCARREGPRRRRSRHRLRARPVLKMWSTRRTGFRQASTWKR